MLALRWTTVLLLLGSVVSAASGPLVGTDRWIAGVYIGRSPRPLIADAAAAWQLADELARQTDGAFVLVGEGDSMNPLYAAGTILVLREVPFTALQRGQTVVFRNIRQRAVAHVLVARTRDGWRTQGVNNAKYDPAPLAADNLVGVVIAAFVPLEPPGLAATPTLKKDEGSRAHNGPVKRTGAPLVTSRTPL